MKRKIQVVVVLAIVFFVQQAHAQIRFRNYPIAQHPVDWFGAEYDDEEEDTIVGFSYGLNLGAYFANKQSANFYNGSCSQNAFIDPNEVRCYSIEERLINQSFQQDYSYISSYYGATGFQIPYDAYPLNMRYQPAVMLGLQLKYNFNRYSAIIFNMNTVKLKATDRYTVQFIGTTQQVNAQNDIRLFPIVGNEQRLNINLGYRQGWMMGDLSNFYFQFGGSMLGTRFQSNQITIADRTYDLVFGGSNPAQIQQFRPRTDIGFGAFGGLGFEYFFAGKYTFDVSFNFSRDKVRLLTFEKSIWNKFLVFTFTI
jgi:hypothetical protein